MNVTKNKLHKQKDYILQSDKALTLFYVVFLVQGFICCARVQKIYYRRGRYFHLSQTHTCAVLSGATLIILVRAENLHRVVYTLTSKDWASSKKLEIKKNERKSHSATSDIYHMSVKLNETCPHEPGDQLLSPIIISFATVPGVHIRCAGMTQWDIT